MTNLIRVALAVCLVMMAACTVQTNTIQTRSAIQSCTASCEQRAAQCNRTCRNNCQQCQAHVAQMTAKDYSRYVHEQSVKGGFIARNFNSYRDPLQCRKVTCNCRADYQICVQSCGGVVKKQLQAAPYCQ